MARSKRYFEDLDEYHGCHDEEMFGLAPLGVGFLHRKQKFETGTSPKKFLLKLATYLLTPVCQRGKVMPCPLCGKHITTEIDGQVVQLGIGEIRVMGDVAAWLRNAATTTLSDAGIQTGGSSGLTLRLTLEEVSIREDVFVNATFDGFVTVRAALLSGDQRLWSASHRGSAENYGEAGSDVNYAETINHALDRALQNLFNRSAFFDALAP